ncbi:unnamed protein product, partial [Effrenium voratum]
MTCKVYAHVDVAGHPSFALPIQVGRPEETQFGTLKQALLDFARKSGDVDAEGEMAYEKLCFWNQDLCPIPDRSPVAAFAWEHNDFFLRPLPRNADGSAGALKASREKRGELSYYYAHNRDRGAFIAKPQATSQVERKPEPIKVPVETSTRFNPKQSPFGTDITKYETLSSYTWEDSDETVKVLVQMDGVGKLNPEQVRSSFGERSFELLVDGLQGRNLRFACYKTHGEMKPEECKHVVRANRVNLILRKAKDKDHWFDLFKKRAIGDDDAWTRDLETEVEKPGEKALRAVEQHLINLGTELSHCSVAFSGLRLQGHMAGTVHISRGLQDEPNPALADPEVANYYLGLFMRKKLAGVRSTRDQSEPSSAMPNGDYWDIDEILAEEQEVAIKSFHDIAGGGFLYPSSGAAKPRDLKEGAKVGVPFWLAQKLARRNCVEVALPAILDEAIRETLQSDPVVCRLGEKSRYYFEVGFKLAALRKDDQLREILLNAFMHRFRDLLGLTSSFGDPSRPDVTQPVQSQFLSSLTGLEEDFYKGAQEAESHFKRWAGSFSCYVMEASHVAEVSAAKRARLGFTGRGCGWPGGSVGGAIEAIHKLFYFLGPSPAMLALCPLMAEDDSQVFRTLLQPGSVVVVRGEACSCHLNPQLSEPCVLLEVDFFPEMKHSPVESASDRVPPPPDLQSWLLGRLKAIVDNDVQENVPEEWIKLARQTFMRSRPMKILE